MKQSYLDDLRQVNTREELLSAFMRIGTSMGFLYVLAAGSGKLRDGFPVQMNEIQGQVIHCSPA